MKIDLSNSEAGGFVLELIEYDNDLLDMVILSGSDSAKLYSAIERVKQLFDLSPLSDFENLDSGRFSQGFSITKNQTQDFKQYMWGGHMGLTTTNN